MNKKIVNISDFNKEQYELLINLFDTKNSNLPHMDQLRYLPSEVNIPEMLVDTQELILRYSPRKLPSFIMNNTFDPIIGSLLLTETQKCQLLKIGFDENDFSIENKLYGSRGRTYYEYLNETSNPTEKLNKIKESVIRFISLSKRNLNQIEQFIIVDYIKHFALVIFHFITHRERSGNYYLTDLNYQEVRTLSLDFVIESTQKYAKCILGEQSNVKFNTDISRLIEKVIVFNTSSPADLFRFKMLEVDDPSLYSISAMKICDNFEIPDLIISIPSGSTAFGYFLQEFILHEKKTYVPVIPVTISTHSGLFFFKSMATQQDISNFIKHELHKNSFEILKGKRVLIVDDNTNTGTTLELIGTTLTALGFENVNYGLIEWDPIRILAQYYPNSKYKESYLNKIVNTLYPDFIKSVSKDIPIGFKNGEYLSTRRLKAVKIIGE